MKKLLNFIVLFCLLSISCSKIIDITIPENECKITLNGLIGKDSNFVVKITKSQSILDTTETFQNISNAQLSLYKDNIFIENLIYQGDGVYFSNQKAQENSEYKIVVEDSFLKTVNTFTKIPSPIQIIKIDTCTKTIISQDDFGSTYSKKMFECKVKFNDPPNEENFYLLTMKDYMKSISYNFTTNQYDTIVFSNFFDFETQDPIINDNSWTKNPFLPHNAYYALTVVFDDAFFNGRDYSFSMLLYPQNNYYSNNEEEYKSIIYLVSISKEYYYYCKSYNFYESYKENQNPFIEPVKVFNNVENGFGIFGSYSIDTLSVTY